MTPTRTRCLKKSMEKESKREPRRTSGFFATVSRMKYIDRWALMRNSRQENLCEHAMEVAMLSHALCTIGNIRLGKDLDGDRAAVIGLYHDAAEIITGDLPTPVKYHDENIQSAYKMVEQAAENSLLDKLPKDLRPSYETIFCAGPDADDKEIYIRKLVKAADKLSALIKCIEEEKAGNREFVLARKTIWQAAEDMAAEMPEVDIFLKEFLPDYEKTLDELQ